MVGEAVALAVPVIASRIAGNVGLLGENYPGYFRPRDTRGLAALLRRAESDPRLLRKLAAACDERRPLFRPMRESMAWTDLLTEMVQDRSRKKKRCSTASWGRPSTSA